MCRDDPCGGLGWAPWTCRDDPCERLDGDDGEDSIVVGLGKRYFGKNLPAWLRIAIDEGCRGEETDEDARNDAPGGGVAPGLDVVSKWAIDVQIMPWRVED